MKIDRILSIASALIIGLGSVINSFPKKVLQHMLQIRPAVIVGHM